MLSVTLPSPVSPAAEPVQVRQQTVTNNTVVNQVVVPQGGYAPPRQQSQASTDLGADPQGDPATEALIQQAASAMRALADMARQAPMHKSAADCMFSELSALKQFMPQGGFYETAGWAPACGQPVPMQPGQIVHHAPPVQQQIGAGWDPGYQRGRAHRAQGRSGR